jgi:hypothetical protein
MPEGRFQASSSFHHLMSLDEKAHQDSSKLIKLDEG